MFLRTRLPNASFYTFVWKPLLCSKDFVAFITTIAHNSPSFLEINDLFSRISFFLPGAVTFVDFFFSIKGKNVGNCFVKF